MYTLTAGGVLTASCHHGVIYGLKVLLRGESVRDHIDLLLSLRYIPNVVINDIPGMTAKHGNHRNPNLFKPFEGRFVDNNEENVSRLQDGTLEISLPFLAVALHGVQSTHSDGDCRDAADVHPVTKSSDVYCAVDRFHSKNIKTDADKLRNVNIVKELRSINTQVQEQYFSELRRDIYFLNSLQPNKFMFILRLIMHLHNVDIRDKQIEITVLVVFMSVNKRI